MNATNRLWHVAAALGLGLLAIVLTTFYVTSYKRHVRHDVAASWEFPESSGHHVARTILQGLLVLRAPAAPPRGSSGGGLAAAPNQGGFSTQIALTDAQSQKLEWALANANWHLELRPPTG